VTKIRTLVVDDEPVARQRVVSLLREEADIDVVGEYATGAQALSAIAAQAPDLLILDVNIPGEDGLSVARRVRAFSTVPILMLTAESDTVDRVAGLEVGADDYMTKPFDLRELRARIQAILRRTGRAQVPGGP